MTDTATQTVSAWLRRCLPQLDLHDSHEYVGRLILDGFCSVDMLNKQLTRNDIAFMTPHHQSALMKWLEQHRLQQQQRETEENEDSEDTENTAVGDRSRTEKRVSFCPTLGYGHTSRYGESPMEETFRSVVHPGLPPPHLFQADSAYEDATSNHFHSPPHSTGLSSGAGSPWNSQYGTPSSGTTDSYAVQAAMVYLNVVEGEMDHWQDAVNDADLDLLTRFSFHLMKQLRVCHYSEADREMEADRGENISVGFKGLQCVHCWGTPDARKFFWSSEDRLRNSFAEIPSHVLNCRWCPIHTKQALGELRQRHSEEVARLPKDSQEVYFRRMWMRLHGDDPIWSKSSSATSASETARTGMVGQLYDRVWSMSQKPRDESVGVVRMGRTTRGLGSSRVGLVSWGDAMSSGPVGWPANSSVFGSAGAAPPSSAALLGRSCGRGTTAATSQSPGSSDDDDDDNAEIQRALAMDAMTQAGSVKNGDDNDDELQRALVMDALAQAGDALKQAGGVIDKIKERKLEDTSVKILTPSLMNLAPPADEACCHGVNDALVAPHKKNGNEKQSENFGSSKLGNESCSDSVDSTASMEQKIAPGEDDSSWTDVGEDDREEEETQTKEKPKKNAMNVANSCVTNESWECDSFSVVSASSSRKDRVRKNRPEEDEASTPDDFTASKRSKTIERKSDSGANDDGAASVGNASGWDTLGSVTSRVARLNLHRLTSGSDATAAAATAFVGTALRSNCDDDDDSIASESNGSTSGLEPTEAWQIIVNLPIVEELRKKVEKASISEKSVSGGGTKSVAVGDTTSKVGDGTTKINDDDGSVGAWTSFSQYDNAVGVEDVTNRIQGMETGWTTSKKLTVGEQCVVNLSSNHLLDAIRHCCNAVDRCMAPSEEVLTLVTTELLTAHMELPETIMVQMDREEIFALVTSRRRFHMGNP